MADNVLHHDHGTIDHHAEIERAQRQQVGRNMAQLKADRGKQQGERNGERNDDCPANIPQKQKENDHHQDDALGQIVQNRMRGVVQKIAAIKKGNHLDSLGQNLVVQFFDLGVDSLQGRIGIISLLQQHDALNRVAVVDDLSVDAMNSLADLAQAYLRPLHNLSDILDPQRGSVGRFENGVVDVLDVAKEAHFTDIDLLLPLLDKAAAGVDVVIGQLLFNLANTQAIGDQLIGIEAHLVFARHSAKAGDIDNPGNRLELLLQRPVFQRLQLHVVVGGVGTMQRVPEDLANRAPVCADLRLQIRRQRDLPKPLQNLLAIPVVDGVVIEDHLDVRKTGQRERAQMLHVGDAGHLNFDGDGDLLLYFFRRAPRPLCDHLNIVVGNIGIRFDRQVMERDGAPDKQQDGDCQDHEPVVQRKINQTTNHYWSTVFCSSRAFDTTCCPAASPEVTSCIPPAIIAPPATPTRLNFPSPAGA